MPSKTFDITARDRTTGKEVKARTAIVNFDSEDPQVAKAEWERLNHNLEIVDISFVSDTTQEEFKRITKLAPPEPPRP